MVAYRAVAMGQPSLKIHEEHSLTLLESPDEGGDGIFNEDGTVNIVVIRPCEGRGPGKRVYTPQLLESTAGMWSGYPSYMNHEDPRATRAQGKLRRGPEELAGELRETFWDPEYETPEDSKYGYLKGAVVGKFMPANELVESLLKRIPKQLKLSINAQATKLRQQRRADGTGWLVEGIQDDPEKSSVDLVTAMGAGGHVRSLIESVYGPGHASSATDGLAALSDEELAGWLREHRPQVLTVGDTVDINVLREALETDEGKQLLAELAPSGVVDETKLQEAVAARVEQERETLTESIRNQVRDELGKSARARSLHSHALSLIESTKLPESAKAILKGRYAIEEADDGETVTPTGSLALVEAVTDDAGAVTKPAKDVLKERIDAEAAELRNALREAHPTLPHAPGGGGPDGGGQPTGTFGGENSPWAQLARKRGLDPALFGATTAQGGDA